jgi:PKD repeat protein
MRVGIILAALLMILATLAGCTKDITLSKSADNPIEDKETLEPRLLDTTFSGFAPLTVFFTNMSISYHDIMSNPGDLGEEVTIAEQNQTHQYDVDRTYTTSLTDTDNLSNNETETRKKYTTVPVNPVLVVDSTPGGSVVDPGEGSLTYTSRNLVNLTAEPEPGFKFFKWEGDVSTVADVYDPTTTITMNNNYKITALFSVWTLDLNEGWNILSTPIALELCCNRWGEFVALGDGLDMGPGAISYYFNGANQLWHQVLAGYVLYPCDAIYVKMANADTAQIIPSSRPSVASKKLFPGWNLISLAALEQLGMGENQMRVDLALTSIYLVKGDKAGYAEVVSPPAGQDSWYYLRDIQPCDAFMEIGKGCWVYMINGGILGGFTCTPW